MIFLSWECKCNFYNLDWTVSESEVQQTFIATSSVSFYMFYITLIPCQASCQVCLLTYGGRNLCVNSPSFDDIWQTSPAIHPPRHLVLHLSHMWNKCQRLFSLKTTFPMKQRRVNSICDVENKYLLWIITQWSHTTVNRTMYAAQLNSPQFAFQ